MARTDAKSRARILVVGLVVVGLALLLLAWLKLPEWQANRFPRGTPMEYRQLVNEYRRTVFQALQALGGLGTLLLIWFTWRNLDLIQRGQNTERFTRAIDQLGATDKQGGQAIEIRLGGIYALDQLAQQRPIEYRLIVVNVFTAYLRENSKHPVPSTEIMNLRKAFPNLDERETLLDICKRLSSGDLPIYKSLQEKLPSAGSDFLTITSILARVRCEEALPLNLADTYLRGTSMSKADLRGVLLARSHVANADFEDVDFSPLQTTREIVHANLTETNWHGTSLKRAKLCKADFRGSKLIATAFDEADVTGTDFSGVDLSEVKGLTQDQVNSAKGNNATKLPPGMAEPSRWTGG
jgi:uncharacterized protein YjbI with pentapeptide repeats